MTKHLLPVESPGTEITRFNALRHGILSRYTVLPWENAEEYQTLVVALVTEHAPQGPTEEHLVEELAGIIWRKRRLRLAEAAAHRRGLEETLAPFRETVKAALVHLDARRSSTRMPIWWTRKGVAHWLVERLSEGAPTLVGIDHGFSFPLRYFETHRLEPDWQEFLDDFQCYWPTDEDHTYVDFIRDGLCGDGEARMGNSRWRRLTEQGAGGAKSVFHFDVPGSVAKSTHAGIPWLRFIRHELGSLVHFWPFDGWEIPQGKSAVAEVYPAVWSRSFARENRTSDQHDAFSIAAWPSRADRDGSLAGFFDPSLTPPGRAVAEVEGWILGLA